MITRISNCANEAPMQRRTPPPNGIHVYASGVRCEEALGAELVGVRIQVLAEVDRGDRGHHQRAGGYAVAAELDLARSACARRR